MNSTSSTTEPSVTEPATRTHTRAGTRVGTHADRRTVVVSERIEIARPAHQVWAAIADYSFDLAWREGITEMTPHPAGPPQNGSRIHEVLRSSGLTFTTDAVVSDVDEGASYRFAGGGTIGEVRGLRLVQPTGDGTAVFTYRVELRPTRHYRMLRSLLRRTLATSLQKDLRRLKQLIEA
jgi:uncharacterized membrane protein